MKPINDPITETGIGEEVVGFKTLPLLEAAGKNAHFASGEQHAADVFRQFLLVYAAELAVALPAGQGRMAHQKNAEERVGYRLVHS